MPFTMGTMVDITLDIHLNNKSVSLIKLSDVRSVEPSDLSDFRLLIAMRTSQFVICG